MRFLSMVNFEKICQRLVTFNRKRLKVEKTMQQINYKHSKIAIKQRIYYLIYTQIYQTGNKLLIKNALDPLNLHTSSCLSLKTSLCLSWLGIMTKPLEHVSPSPKRIPRIVPEEIRQL